METEESCAASDLSDWRVWAHSSNLKTTEELELWWEERLLEAATKGEFFLRLEDDVVVNQHIEHNVKSWKALSRPDFGFGMLFMMKNAPYYRHKTEDGMTYSEDRIDIYGPGIVFRAEVVPSLVKQMRKIRDEGRNRRMLLVNFDQILQQAAMELGLKAFVHEEPCLVDCVKGNGKSTVGEDHDDYHAHNFDIDWKAA